MAARKIKEYPHCDLLIYSAATVLNSALALAEINEKKKLEYDAIIMGWFERTKNSQDEKVRISTIYMLAAKYMQMEKYDEAGVLLDKIPDTKIDTAILKANILTHQEGQNAAAIFMEGKLMQVMTNVQNYMYKLIEIEEETGNHREAEKIAEITDKMVSLFGLWNYGRVVPHLLIALYRKDTEKCVKLIREALNEAQKPWNKTESPLYYRYFESLPHPSFSGVGNSFARTLISEIESKKEYDFLKGNKELEMILQEYQK